MQSFKYKAATEKGNIVEGLMDVENRDAVLKRLRELGYFPLEVEKVEKEQEASNFSFSFGADRITGKDITLFTQQLASLLNAGMQLDRSIAIIIELISNKKMRDVVLEIRKEIQNGSAFSEALEKFPHIFSRFYINMVKAGEWGGVLEITMARLAEHLEKDQEVKSFLKSSMIYPSLMITASIGAIVILLTFVIPKLMGVFKNMGQTLPLPTLLLVQASKLFTFYWWVLVLIGAGLVFAYQSYYRTEKGRYQIDNIKLNIPVIGKLIIYSAVAQFSRTVATITKNGVPLLQALYITKDTIDNSVVSMAILRVHNGVKEGGGFVKFLKEQNIFPVLAVHMIGVGEETGDLSGMMEKVANIYDTEVRNTVKGLVSMLEPATILFMAVVVGYIVISMLLPILSMTNIDI